ncbi:MAG: exosortase-associated EpsI family protein [Pirellulaceae bacterium]
MSLRYGTLTSRLWTTSLVVIVAFGLGGLLLYRVSSADVRPLNATFSELPMEIEDYVGEDREFDEEIARSVGAMDSVSRIYTNPSGVEISLHAASWNSLLQPTLPHPPTICYVASGAQIVDSRFVSVGKDEPPVEARLLTIDRDGMKSLVLYWYRWDDKVCTTRSQATLARLALVGESAWPPVVKVMLETQCGLSADDALRSLTSFAAEVHDWTKTL